MVLVFKSLNFIPKGSTQIDQMDLEISTADFTDRYLEEYIESKCKEQIN